MSTYPSDGPGADLPTWAMLLIGLICTPLAWCALFICLDLLRTLKKRRG